MTSAELQLHLQSLMDPCSFGCCTKTSEYICFSKARGLEAQGKGYGCLFLLLFQSSTYQTILKVLILSHNLNLSNSHFMRTTRNKERRKKRRKFRKLLVFHVHHWILWLLARALNSVKDSICSGTNAMGQVVCSKDHL